MADAARRSTSTASRRTASVHGNDKRLRGGGGRRRHDRSCRPGSVRSATGPYAGMTGARENDMATIWQRVGTFLGLVEEPYDDDEYDLPGDEPSHSGVAVRRERVAEPPPR